MGDDRPTRYRKRGEQLTTTDLITCLTKIEKAHGDLTVKLIGSVHVLDIDDVVVVEHDMIPVYVLLTI